MDLKESYEILCKMRKEAEKEIEKKDWMVLLDKTCDAMTLELQKGTEQKDKNDVNVLVKKENMITLVEWSRKIGMNSETARKYANIGKIPAKKFGRDWVIAEDVEPDNYKPHQK